MFFDGYRVARNWSLQGNDRKERFLNRIIRRRFNALQVVRVPRAELFTNLKKKRLWIRKNFRKNTTTVFWYAVQKTKSKKYSIFAI